MQNLFQRMVNLGAPTQAFGEALGPHGHNHEFLEVDIVVGMHAAVEDIHHRSGQQMRIRATHIAIQRQFAGLGRSARTSKRRTQHGIRTKISLIGSAIKIDHLGVDGTLVARIHPDKSFGNFLVHMSNGLLHAFAEIAARIAVAQLDSLECAGRSSRRNDRTRKRAIVESDFDFDRRITARVEDFPTVNVEDDAHEDCLLDWT